MATTIGSLDLNAFSDLHSDLTQYFWFEPNATATYGAGAHVTLVPDTSFISNPTGQNILMNTDGFSIRNGLLPMMTLDNDSLDFNVVDTTAGTYTTTATFTSTGAQIGQSGAAHSVIDANGQRFYGGSDGTVQLANIGYGEGAAETGTAIAPYYTFGTRASGSTIGSYSMAEGFSTIASGYNSHAEGSGTAAIGYYSHAEGSMTTASDPYSHAEGRFTKARGEVSHAEGYSSTTNGYCAHVEGCATRASGHVSHVIGMFNKEDSSYYVLTTDSYVHLYKTYYTYNYDAYTPVSNPKDDQISTYYEHIDYEPGEMISGGYAFIIGNGTSTRTRSNAFTVDWSGNMWAENYYPVGSVYIHQDNTNPADILGFGTWTQIHRRFRYAIVEDAVTFNSTNVNTATGTGSVCILDGDTVYLRLTVTTKVALTDTPSIEIGTLDFSKIGLTTCYYGQFPFLTDNGNGIAMFSLNNQNGVIQSEDVITKASNGTIAAGATGYCMIPILFARGSMIDSFCNEFHWRRTA